MSARLRAACLMAAILLACGIILTVLKVLTAPKLESSFVNYIAPEEEGMVQETKKQKDLTPSRPVSAPPVVIAAETTVDTAFTVDPIDISDSPFPVGDSFLSGGGDLGNGTGGDNKGGMGSRGEKPESAFLGVFIDLKKKRDGSPSAFAGKEANTDVLNQESSFVNRVWDLQYFSSYFRSRQQLYATCFYMPNCSDKEACHAYDPDGKMGLKPGRWLALYRAKVKAPVSGTFRFIGVADSVMAVRFDGKNVLMCGLHDLKTSTWGLWNPQTNARANEGRELYPYESCAIWNEMEGGFVAGEEFEVKEGQWYEMQVLVSEIGGGEFGFCLLIDEKNNTSAKRTRDGVPVFQLFRTAFSAPTAAEAYENIMFKDESRYTDPPYDPDSGVWVAKPVAPDVRMK